MKRADITNEMIIREIVAADRRFQTTTDYLGFENAYMKIIRQTGALEIVVYRAFERAIRKGLMDYGTSPRSPFLTPAGQAMARDLGVLP